MVAKRSVAVGSQRRGLPARSFLFGLRRSLLCGSWGRGHRWRVGENISAFACSYFLSRGFSQRRVFQRAQSSEKNRERSQSVLPKWGYGATVARLTPDQKVGSSNLSALIWPIYAMQCQMLRGGQGILDKEASATAPCYFLAWVGRGALTIIARNPCKKNLILQQASGGMAQRQRV